MSEVIDILYGVAILGLLWLVMIAHLRMNRLWGALQLLTEAIEQQNRVRVKEKADAERVRKAATSHAGSGPRP